MYISYIYLGTSVVVMYFNTALYVFKYISNSTQIRINPSIVFYHILKLINMYLCLRKYPDADYAPEYLTNAMIHAIAIDTHINSIHIHSQNTTSRALQN